MASSFKAGLNQQAWVPILIAGLVLGMTATLTGVLPMAALIFSGELAPFLPMGIGLTLVSAAVTGIFLALRSSLVGLIAFPVAEEAMIIGVMTAGIVQAMPQATPETVWLTLVAGIALSSLLTGAFLFLLGHFRLGELIRFLPYPVISGFLAGLGFLIVNGGFRVTTNLDLSWQNCLPLLQPDLLPRWGSAFLLAVVLAFLTRRYRHFLLLPGSVVGAISLFYITLLISRISLDQAAQGGWLLGPFPDSSAWMPFNWKALAQIDWPILLGQSGNVLSLMLITPLSVLLISSALELITERDMNLNQELQETGLACILSGLLGGMVGSHSVTTLLGETMNVNSRWVSLIAALVHLVFLVLGLSVLTFFPKPVLAGLVMFIGLDLLILQLYNGWQKLPRADYIIVLVIMGVVAVWGFVVGVLAGLVITLAQFVLNYSRINVAPYALSGATLNSNRKRTPNQEQLLRKQGDSLYVLPLQGFVFFGTAHSLLQQIRQRVNRPDLLPPRYIVLDCLKVTGLDSSAVMSFVKLTQLARKQSMQILFTHLSPDLEKALRQGQVIQPENDICLMFPDLDRGLEWCENQLLAKGQYRRARVLPLALQLKAFLALTSDQIAVLKQYLEPMDLAVGDRLFTQGDAPDRLYFVESGEISTVLDAGSGELKRMQTLGPGTILGEVEFHTQTPYGLSAIADRSTKLYCLSRQVWDRLRQEHPQITVVLSEQINALLANRLSSLQQTLINLTH